MPKIALSYRRQDSAAMAGRLFDWLVARYGEESVFVDIDSIPIGIDFREHLVDTLGKIDVLLAIIGPQWAGPLPGGGLRIDDPADMVRVEIETALGRGTPVVPVLIDRAEMPRADALPESLRAFAFRNAAEVTSGRDFRVHMERLAGSIDRLAGSGPSRPKTTPSPPPPPLREPVAAEVDAVPDLRQGDSRPGLAPKQPARDIPQSTDHEPLLRMRGISKSFPGVLALSDVDFEVAPGEIHALLGENGAGKSTLLKILAGAQPQDSGTIEFAGKQVAFGSPHAAQMLGIVTIYQEFTLAPNMTICENVFIGREPGSRMFVSWRRMAEETRALTRRIGLDANPMTLVRELSVAEQQMVEIARALSMKSRLIVMDEPTSALSRAEVEKLFKIVRDLKQEGLSVIFVTHRLEEVFEICDSYTVLRDGKFVGSGKVADTNIDGIIRMMVGREVNALFSHRTDATAGAVALAVEGLSRRGTTRDPSATVLADVSLSVRRGEILGVAGLVGAGRTEMARAVFGADPFDSGHILIDDKPVHISSPQEAIRHGIGLVPEDRKQQALFLSLAIRMNLSMASLGRVTKWGVFIDEAKESALVEEYRKALSIRMASPEQIVANLSGGNQQKVVLARWLALQPKVLIVDEPTRGIDIGAKVDVHNLLFDMARSGIAVIAISSELPEVLAISDRIVTMREGRVTGEISRAEADQEKLMSMMTLAKAA